MGKRTILFKAAVIDCWHVVNVIFYVFFFSELLIDIY